MKEEVGPSPFQRSPKVEHNPHQPHAFDGHIVTSIGRMSLKERIQKRRQEAMYSQIIITPYTDQTSDPETGHSSQGEAINFNLNPVIEGERLRRKPGSLAKERKRKASRLPPEERFANHINVAKGITLSMFKGRDAQIFSLLDQCMPVDLIAQEIGLTVKSTERVLANLRKKIDGEIFSSLGVLPITAFKDDPSINYDSLVNAAVNKRLLVTKFYSRFYTTRYAVERYKKTRKDKIPAKIGRRPIVQLHSALPYKDYALFKDKPQYARKMFLINGVYCAYESDVEDFKQAITPQPNERPLVDVAKDEDEKFELQGKARRKEIPSMRRRGSRVYIFDDEAGVKPQS